MTGHTPWREIKHKKDVPGAAPRPNPPEDAGLVNGAGSFFSLLWPLGVVVLVGVAAWFIGWLA